MMFDIDFSSKRARLAIRFFTYGVMTVTTIVISVIMIFFALGYRLDRNFNFAQGGLVQFKSFPSDAEIIIDGSLSGLETSNKANLSAGSHSIEFRKDGYESWSKDFDLDPGQLLWLNYARLIPSSISTEDVRELNDLNAMSVSPDKHWALLQPKSSSLGFILADISNEKDVKFKDIAISEDVFTKKNNKLGLISVVEWDLSSEYVLLKHDNAGSSELIRFNRSKPDEAINLTRVFGLNIVEAHFSAGDSNILFANTDGMLRRLNIKDKSASGVLVNNLKQFEMYGGGSIAFVNEQELTSGKASSKRQVLGIWRNDKLTTVRRFPVDSEIVFDYSEYDDHKYLAVGTKDSKTIEVLRDPGTEGAEDADSAILDQFDLEKEVELIRFSDNGRMIAAQNGSSMASYDIEEAKSYQKTLDFGVDVTQPLKWLDDFYLWTNAGNKIRIVEFDGTNSHDIVDAKEGYNVSLSNNGERLFSVRSNDGKLVLQSSLLIIKD